MQNLVDILRLFTMSASYDCLTSCICFWCSTSICLMLDCSCSIVSSRIAITSRKSSLLCSNDFILPLPKRELTPLASAVVASVATLLSLSVHISDFTCLSSCSARPIWCSLCCHSVKVYNLLLERKLLFI